MKKGNTSDRLLAGEKLSLEERIAGRFELLEEVLSTKRHLGQMLLARALVAVFRADVKQLQKQGKQP